MTSTHGERPRPAWRPLLTALAASCLLWACGPSGSAAGGVHPGVGAQCVSPTDCAAFSAPPSCQLWGCTSGACVLLAAPDDAVCQQGDACHPGVCGFGVCKVSPVTCAPTGDPCVTSVCDPVDGQCRPKPAAKGTPCDDGRDCSLQDACQYGVCAGDASACPCTKDQDCPDDGDRCNGLSYCDQSTGKCATNPATVVVCATGKDTACAKAACDPPTGLCALAPVVGKAVCDDGDDCTTGDVCAKGVCVAGTFTCDCQDDADCVDDGDLCNGTPFCNKALNKCVHNPATAVVCPSVGDTACRATLCQPTKGVCAKVPVSEGKACDDGNPCTADETCKGGSCSSANSLCECAQDSDCAGKEDGDLCNGTLYCDQVVKQCKVSPATVVTCPSVDNTPCRANACQAKTGACKLVLKPAGTPCDDGAPCTTGETCAGGVCGTGAVAAQCACATDSDCAKFEGGNACVGDLRCALGVQVPVCAPKPGTGVVCKSDGNPCTVSACDPKSGACKTTSLPDGAVCAAPSGCFGASTCQAGVCKAAKAEACDDGDPCTSDGCVGQACAHKPVAAGTQVPCYDGAAGTLGVGVCKAGTTTCGADGKPGACTGAVTPATVDGCGGGNEDCDATTDEDCDAGLSVAKICGTGQQGPPGQTLSQRLLVKVTKTGGAAASGVTVSWSSTNGGTFSAPTSTTNSAGQAAAMFTLPATGGTTAVATASVPGASTNFSFPVTVGAPLALLDYPTFCDASQLSLLGTAALAGNRLRIVAKGDLHNGSAWFTKPAPANTDFEWHVSIEGYTPGYGLVLQAVGGTKQSAGGNGDAGTAKLNPALVVRVTGGYSAGSAHPATVQLYGNGKLLGQKVGALAKNQTLKLQSFWVTYTQATKKVAVYVAPGGSKKPSGAIVQATWDVWAGLGGKPAYVGFTAGNSTAGQTGNKLVTRWSFATK